MLSSLKSILFSFLFILILFTFISSLINILFHLLLSLPKLLFSIVGKISLFTYILLTYRSSDISTLPTISNNNNFIGKLLIPNETYGINDAVGDSTSKIEQVGEDDVFVDVDGGTKAFAKVPTSMVVKLKSNYVCTLYPVKINTIRVTLEGLKSGNTIDTIETISCGAGGRLQIGLLFKNR